MPDTAPDSQRKDKPIGRLVAVAPLFDQLTDSQVPTQIRLTKDQLLESIREELTLLFETRSSFSQADIDTLLNIPDAKGFPGFRGLPPFEDSAQFERQCEGMIRLFEPRLLDPSVVIIRSESFRLTLQIQGAVALQNLREKVSISITVQSSNKTQSQ